MKTKTITQIITFAANPMTIYDLLMDEKKHAAFTNSEVSISNEIEGKFSVFDDYCHGYNIELIPGDKIVQAWHFSEDGWPADHFSICTFQFENDADKTKLIFTQTEVPEHKVKELKDGWRAYYWKPMKVYLSEN